MEHVLKHAHLYPIYLISIMMMASMYANQLHVHDIKLLLTHKHIYVLKRAHKQTSLIKRLVVNVTVMNV